MRSYIAFVHKEDRDYLVTFPDFPGCVAAGGTLDQAMDGAREALARHVENLREDGAVIPEPMGLERARAADPSGRQALAFPVGVPWEAPLV
jgi:predicted RNase H-like HicB family nuclease